MSDTPSTPPAMSPDEWRRRLRESSEYDARPEGDRAREARLFGPEPTPAEVFADAALLLHLSTFGFTREEALALRDLLNLIDRDSIEDIVALSLSALAKIEALLPPE